MSPVLPLMLCGEDAHGTDFSYLDQHLPGVAQQIMLTAERHIAYPVLHDFRSRDVGTASERTLAMLDDVLTLHEHGRWLHPSQPPRYGAERNHFYASR